MKICDHCRVEFQVSSKGSGGSNRRFCYLCLPDGLNRYNRNNIRNKLLTKMGHEHKVSLGCSRCGYNKYGGALEWHHTDKNKEIHPSEALARSWDKYLEEIQKCILLCANCHREEHAPDEFK